MIKLKLMEVPCVSITGYIYPENFWSVVMNGPIAKEMMESNALFIKPFETYKDDKNGVSLTNILGAVQSYNEEDNSVVVTPIGNYLKEDYQCVLYPYITANVNPHNEITLDDVDLICLHIKERE